MTPTIEAMTRTLDVPGATLTWQPPYEALRLASTRIVLGVGEESRETVTGRAAVALADRLGLAPVFFPSHHGGFLGGEHGYAGKPAAFAATLREVLSSASGRAHAGR